MDVPIIIIGGGLAGAEAAWQIAERGIKVKLYEMRPNLETGAHTTGDLAELICSNSLGSNLSDRASGVLKNELRLLGSLLIQIADQTAVPAGNALAVDRGKFSREVTTRLANHQNIEIIREEVRTFPPQGIVVLASGPLTSPAMSASLSEFCGLDNLYFFDAISPIVEAGSIDMNIAYNGSRWDDSGEIEGDYINCPFHSKPEYQNFYQELVTAERIELKVFEKIIDQGVQAGPGQYFEGCLPVEVIAQRSEKALLFGPMRPVGLKDPRIERPPYAVVQLRKENIAADLYNLVGFQTNLTFSEQRRIIRLIPGLQNAEIIRYGQMHRNTFISAPEILLPSLQTRKRPTMFLAGQITGVEGYAGNIATGLLAGINAVRLAQDKTLMVLPFETMIGSLCNYITMTDHKTFQPMKANFGILPKLDEDGQKGNKRDRAGKYAIRAERVLKEYLHDVSIY